MRKIFIITILLCFNFGISQIAIGKTTVSNSSVSVEFNSGNRGIILPWVTAAGSVTGAVDGTLIYDVTDKRVKYLRSGSWIDLSVDAKGTVDTILQDPYPESSSAKVAIGSNGGLDTTAGILVLTDTNKAMIIPKVAQPYLNIISPAAGMMVYDTTAHQLAVFNGTVWSFWRPGPKLAGLSCATSTTTRTITAGVPAYGVSSSIPYTGGNGAKYNAQVIPSTGVTGLNATLTAGTLANNGNGSLNYTITGIASAGGTASFPISMGGQSCTLNLTVQSDPSTLPIGSGSLSGRMCFDVVMVNAGSDCGTLASRASQKADFSQTATNTQTYTFTPTGSVSNVRFVYVNTNGAVFNSITGGNPGNNISTPVTATVNYNTGLNALASGLNFMNALGGRVYVIYNDNATGTGVDRALALTVKVQDCACCNAYTAPGVIKTFMCHNLGADMNAEPFIPSVSLHGAKYQWGRSTPILTQAQDQANSGVIAGWNTTAAANGSWQDGVKTANDPCPVGYRVPTSAQWTGISNNNTKTYLGTWTDSATNYSSAIQYGNYLILPSAGSRGVSNGILVSRGSSGVYSSSTENASTNNYINNISNGVNNILSTDRTVGQSVRCISE